MIQALIFLLDTFAQLYLLILLLRFWLPLMRANFRNPVAQGVLKYTSPLVVPVRRYIPSVGRLDTATVLVAFVIQFLVALLIQILGHGMAALGILASPRGILVLGIFPFSLLALLRFFDSNGNLPAAIKAVRAFLYCSVPEVFLLGKRSNTPMLDS